jgi:hypothetical protein
MKQRGRKSAAALSVISISAASRRPEPPAELTAPQAKTWRGIIESTPDGWFSVAQEPLLAAYCRHVSASRYLSDIINKSKVEDDLDRYGKLLAMRVRETMAISSLATRMRLTQQAQMHPRTASRAMTDQHGGPKLWDRTPPWEG